MRQTTEIGRYLGWPAEHRGVAFTDYAALYRWPVDDLEGFWSSIWEFFDVRGRSAPSRVLGWRDMPGGGVVPRRHAQPC